MKWVHFCSIFALLAEKTWLQQKLYRKERQNCLFRVKSNFSQNVVSLKNLQIFDQFLLWADKTSFFCGIFSAELSKVPCLMSTKHSELKSVHWIIYNFVQIFPKFGPKKSRLQQKSFAMAVKFAFFVSIKYFQVRSIGKMITNLSIFLGFEQKKFRSLANFFPYTCQYCLSPVQQTFRGKYILVKCITFCP